MQLCGSAIRCFGKRVGGCGARRWVYTCSRYRGRVPSGPTEHPFTAHRRTNSRPSGAADARCPDRVRAPGISDRRDRRSDIEIERFLASTPTRSGIAGRGRRRRRSELADKPLRATFRALRRPHACRGRRTHRRGSSSARATSHRHPLRYTADVSECTGRTIARSTKSAKASTTPDGRRSARWAVRRPVPPTSARNARLRMHRLRSLRDGVWQRTRDWHRLPHSCPSPSFGGLPTPRSAFVPGAKLRRCRRVASAVPHSEVRRQVERSNPVGLLLLVAESARP